MSGARTMTLRWQICPLHCPALTLCGYELGRRKVVHNGVHIKTLLGKNPLVIFLGRSFEGGSGKVWERHCMVAAGRGQ